ncbi:MAG: peptidylprolyl isomerase [Kofleriaceae bacterium]
MEAQRVWLIAGLALALGACEHKNGKNNNGGGGNGTPEPVTKEEVRPPVAEDLAEYTKDLAGTGQKLMARIETPLGTLNCELYPDKAPATVANFVGLATGKKPWKDPKSGQVQKGKPFFDGLQFHRVIAGFMIQGGDPTASGSSGPGYKFADELSPDLDMGPGTLAMANAGPRTNGSQFFVMEGTRPDLAKKHSIFGMCKEVEVISKITTTPASSDRPNEPVTMKVTITKG